jgi:hypothetical protein
MRSVLRGTLAVVVGFIVASVVMMAVESVNGRFLYPELGRMAQRMTDREAIRGLMASAPVGAFLVVILGWVLGSLAGGCAAAWIGKRVRIRLGLVLGFLLTLGGIANNLMLPPPLWFWVVGLVLFIPAAFIGARLAPQPTSKP